MNTHYDLIIVGSGAGGGTLARHLAPPGKSILILERGDWLTREEQNWDPTAVFVKNRYVSKDTWYDQTGKAFQPQVHYFVVGQPRCTVPLSTVSAKKTFANSSTMTVSPRRGQSAMTRWNRTTPKLSRSITCTDFGALTPPNHPAVHPIRMSRYRTSRVLRDKASLVVAITLTD